MSLEEKMFNVGGRPFGIMMWANSLMEFFFFDGGCLRKIVIKGGGVGRDGCRDGWEGGFSSFVGVDFFFYFILLFPQVTTPKK